MEDMPLFTDFKIKASFGTNGNLPGSYYGYMDLFTGSGYGNNPAIYWSSISNDKLSWEKSKNFNVGFEWNMYDRVNLSIEYYNKKQLICCLRFQPLLLLVLRVVGKIWVV